ncbi:MULTISPECIES: DUF1896 domain-containing protein [Capnocytophaga]|uniref:DUF1896 domain-containing protein n=2 Tax=Capnocytophaga TaxID=1016 RepID=A0A0B7HDP7_9FLAO|nr:MULTISPECIES: DUF1896 domain-containing protein [Capnocytophaga]AYW36348.1 DUF1896 domain-containing protein [Capnocytophaga canimorsus]CEN36734.1 conserved hypothetical protein [Capnocytophaga cynodegmi]
MNHQKVQPSLSYYELRLREVLKTSFPNLINNTTFIKERSDLAAHSYQQAFESGLAIPQCNEIANKVLMEGLHFSPFSMVFEVLCREFQGELSEEELFPFALKMFEELVPFFQKYDLTEDFEQTQDYGHLYTELTGAIQIWIEENGIS